MNVINYGGGNNIKQCMFHEHSCWEIVIHCAGHVTSVIGNHTYDISEGDVMVIPPGVKHNGSSDAEYSDLFVQADSLDFLDVLVIHDFDGNILTLMKMLHKVLIEKEENHIHIANSLLETICQFVKKLAAAPSQNPVVNKLKNTIYENIGNTDFDLKQEIANTGFHPDYLRRCFKAEIGKPPQNYLIWLRINHAKSLLIQDTFISVENVARQCGFHDFFYFSTCFKKHTGMAPLQYRKSNRRR